MPDKFRTRERYGEAFWRKHHEAWQQSALNSTRVLRSARDSAQGVRQLAGEVQSGAATAIAQAALPARWG